MLIYSWTDQCYKYHLTNNTKYLLIFLFVCLSSKERIVNFVKVPSIPQRIPVSFMTL